VACEIDGHATKPLIAADLSGTDTIEIELSGQSDGQATPHVSASSTAPATPKPIYADGRLTWPSLPRATGYHLYRNAKLIGSTQEPSFAVRDGAAGEYQVTGVDQEGHESFLSEPISVHAETYRALIEGPHAQAGVPAELSVEAEQALQQRAAQGVMLSRDDPKGLRVPVLLPRAGVFELRFHYANGNGPINTENKCAIRTLYIDGRRAGTSVLPQRGPNVWTNYGISSAVRVSLEKGEHLIELRLEPEDENMNPDVNQALVDAMYFQLSEKE
jgi:hypothetical protein